MTTKKAKIKPQGYWEQLLMKRQGRLAVGTTRNRVLMTFMADYLAEKERELLEGDPSMPAPKGILSLD